MAKPDVRVGQVWADNDKREKGRTLEVVEVGETHALAKVLTPASTSVTKNLRPARIALKRFRPTSTGYRLIQDVSRGDG